MVIKDLLKVSPNKSAILSPYSAERTKPSSLSLSPQASISQTLPVYKEEQSTVHLRSIDFQYFKDINVSSLTQYY